MLKQLKILVGYRALNIFAFALIFFILCYAGFVQMHSHIDPCPLCVMQRIAFAAMAILFLFAALHVARTFGRRVLHTLILIPGLSGLALAARQVYLQHLPPELAPSCGPGLNFIVKNLPPHEALRMLLMGTGECAQIKWIFLNLSMPEWSLICFIGLVILNLFQLFREV